MRDVSCAKDLAGCVFFNGYGTFLPAIRHPLRV
jgi:hypothetical protein